ncbi:hypothetical protein [Caballeronia mineralivorans]|uniref:hypothetical protein n=1 Tax=Caballeronia mineralivorans TaxID=2010198 RepID=UPI00128DD1CF|nr:hypothetical protein [Caballeronia mineralivorans]
MSRIVRATQVQGGEIDWAETDLSVELSKKGDSCTAYVGTVPAKVGKPGVDCHGLILRRERAIG